MVLPYALHEPVDVVFFRDDDELHAMLAAETRLSLVPLAPDLPGQAGWFLSGFLRMERRP